MADLELAKGSKGYDINFTVTDDDGAYDLTDHTITFNICDRNYTNKLSVTGTIVVAASGTCKYAVTGTDLDLPKSNAYLGELSLTTAAGLLLPNVDKFTIEIVEGCG